MKHIFFTGLLFILLSSCGSETKTEPIQRASPIVNEGGKNIQFPEASHLEFFKTEILKNDTLSAKFTAPAHIAATVLASREGASQNLILFENPELASHYTQLTQLQISINQISNINLKQRRLELERTKDLQLHGVATGQDLMDAESALSMELSELANEKAALIEHESKLIAEGFTPNVLRKAKAGTVFLICDIPENQIGNIEEGSTCDIKFNAFPNTEFSGKVDAIADVVDHSTRMIKARILVNNTSKKLKSGMFANVTFDLSDDHNVSVSKNALVTIQGKHYVFIKTSENQFERKEVNIGQHIGDRIIVFDGVSSADEVAIEGVLQLKGLSFGY
ncbi:MAG: efflux RND transporter periplasmic adaptor subunit [Xanthomarina sp.]